jgi:hypothetical protein
LCAKLLCGVREEGRGGVGSGQNACMQVGDDGMHAYACKATQRVCVQAPPPPRLAHVRECGGLCA